MVVDWLFSFSANQINLTRLGCSILDSVLAIWNISGIANYPEMPVPISAFQTLDYVSYAEKKILE